MTTSFLVIVEERFLIFLSHTFFIQPEDDYTEPESGSEDYSRVQTPVRTPSAASQPESRPLSHVSTPDQTEIPDSISSSTPDDEKVDNDVTSGHVVPDRLSEEIEEG
jgi:hypothetical protein